jgi:cytochrome P450
VLLDCRLSDVELCDNLMLLILAGHDTSRWAVAVHTSPWL